MIDLYKSTQQDMVLYHISTFGSITPAEAEKAYGITRLADVIFKLQKKGYEFDHIMQTNKNRFGKKVRYMRYSYKCEE